MKAVETPALSTVGYSAYQILCLHGPQTAKSVLERLRPWTEDSHYSLSAKAVERAFAEMAKRSYVALESGKATVKDPFRRLLTGRAREGDGWSGWQVRDRILPLEPAR